MKKIFKIIWLIILVLVLLIVSSIVYNLFFTNLSWKKVLNKIWVIKPTCYDAIYKDYWYNSVTNTRSSIMVYEVMKLEKEVRNNKKKYIPKYCKDEEEFEKEISKIWKEWRSAFWF